MDAADILRASPVVPVIVVNDPEDAVPLGQALLDGGIGVLEVTLRTDAGIESIRRLRAALPDAIVGAGTVTSAEQLQQVIDAGAQFAISPGMTDALLIAGNGAEIPLIPGVASVSELMRAMELGYRQVKFFPAEAAGGIAMLKAMAGPFPNIQFCPTGGIGAHNYRDYLALPNVACVGGSWVVPGDAVANGDWNAITELSRQAIQSLQAT